jgi:DNA-binding transcriptional LysR family regulator
MELRQLKTFQTVARLSSFNRAAEVLNYAQSTISAQIKLLEEELRVSLFDRLGKRVRLTEAGQMLLQYSQKMMDLEKETISRVADWEEPHGSLSIRMPQSIATYYLPEVLGRFVESFPRIGLHINTCAYQPLQHELRTGVTDVAFLFADSIQSSELTAELLRVESLAIIASPDHPLATRSVMHIRDLEGEHIILPKHDCSYKMTFEQILTEEKLKSATFIELNSIEALKRCVVAGLGVAMIPMMAVEQEIEQKLLVILPWAEERLETGILMIRHKDKWLSPTLKAFMSAVREVMNR